MSALHIARHKAPPHSYAMVVRTWLCCCLPSLINIMIPQGNQYLWPSTCTCTCTCEDVGLRDKRRHTYCGTQQMTLSLTCIYVNMLESNSISHAPAVANCIDSTSAYIHRTNTEISMWFEVPQLFCYAYGNTTKNLCCFQCLDKHFQYLHSYIMATCLLTIATLLGTKNSKFEHNYEH